MPEEHTGVKVESQIRTKGINIFTNRETLGIRDAATQTLP